jgi:GTP cyclohydrolase I
MTKKKESEFNIGAIYYRQCEKREYFWLRERISDSLLLLQENGQFQLAFDIDDFKLNYKQVEDIGYPVTQEQFEKFVARIRSNRNELTKALKENYFSPAKFVLSETLDEVKNDITKELPESYGEVYGNINMPSTFEILKHGLEVHVRQLIKETGENPDRPGLEETPKRVVKALKEMTSGYRDDPKKHLKLFDYEDTDTHKELVITKVHFNGLCEHHLLPFFGDLWVGYQPNTKVLGLSKVSRIVDCFSKRLTLQEKVVSDVFNFLYENLETKDLFVYAKATHTCIACRGANQDTSNTQSFKGTIGFSFNDMKTLCKE